MKQLLNYFNLLVSTIFDRIEDSSWVEVSHLASFRIFLGIFFLFFLTPSWSWIGNVPDAFFYPPLLSFANLFSDFPHPVIFYLIDSIIYILLGFITLGIKSRISFILIFLIGIFANSFTFSFGKIDHSILLWICMGTLAFTNSGTKLAFVKDKMIPQKYQKIALSVFSICIAFGFFSAGFHKMFSWVDFDLSTNGFLRWFYNNYFVFGKQALLSNHVLSLPIWVFEAMDYTAVLFEMSAFIFLILGRKYWRGYLITAVVFHIINLLVLNINFINHLPVYGVFLISPFLYFILKKFEWNYRYRWLVGLIILFRCLFMIFTSIFSGTSGYLQFNFPQIMNYYFSIFVWFCLIIISIYSFSKNLYKSNYLYD